MSTGPGAQLIRRPALLTLVPGEDSNGEPWGINSVHSQLARQSSCTSSSEGVGSFPRSGMYRVRRTHLGSLVRSQRHNLALSPPLRWQIVLRMKSCKDTSGIFRPKKLEEQRGGSSRLSGTLFAGTVRLGYVSPPTDTPWCLAFGNFTERIGVRACRKIACGSRIRRPSIISSTNLVICMQSRTALGNWQCC